MLIRGPGAWEGVEVAQVVFAAQGMSVKADRQAGKCT